MESELLDQSAQRAQRLRKQTFIAEIPANASVVAPLPYLSHLAMREKLYSLHYILKGLKTLSRERYQPPPPTDFVLIDYDDTATFDAGAGYYHPPMRTAHGEVVPSSDRLLNEFLKLADWEVKSENELTLFRRRPGETAMPGALSGQPIFSIESHSQLLSLHLSRAVVSEIEPLECRLGWNFTGDRQVFPWMWLHVTRNGRTTLVTKGLCAPEATTGNYMEVWRVTDTTGLAPGQYDVEALFFDNARRAFLAEHGGNWRDTLLAPPVPLGKLTVRAPSQDRRGD